METKLFKQIRYLKQNGFVFSKCIVIMQYSIHRKKLKIKMIASHVSVQTVEEDFHIAGILVIKLSCEFQGRWFLFV